MRGQFSSEVSPNYRPFSSKVSNNYRFHPVDQRRLNCSCLVCKEPSGLSHSEWGVGMLTEGPNIPLHIHSQRMSEEMVNGGRVNKW